MDGYLGYGEQLNTKTFSNLMKQIDKCYPPRRNSRGLELLSTQSRKVQSL
jgi:hypothetical protein